MINYTIIELAIISALLSLFLDFCFREGHIFEKWLDMWADFFLEMEGKKIKYPKDVNKRDYKFSQVQSKWFKPLGYCIVCTNFYISVVIGFIGLMVLCEDYNILHIVLIAFIAHFIVRLTHGRLL